MQQATRQQVRRVTGLECPACSNNVHRHLERQVYECCRCEGIHGTIYGGEWYEGRYVKPVWSSHEVPVEHTRYFDFTLLGGDGVKRVHGWYDMISKQIVQVG